MQSRCCLQPGRSPSLAPAPHAGRRHQQQHSRSRQTCASIRCEQKEYYDYKDMPPLPLTVKRIAVPQLGYTVVDKSVEEMRMASLAIFYDIFSDDQYAARLTRKSALTALCMFDKEDVSRAQSKPGDYPNIDLLFKVCEGNLDLPFEVEEFKPE